MTSLLYHLLRIGMGIQSSLYQTPTEAEWEETYQEAKKQAIVGICYVAIKKLLDEGKAEMMDENSLYVATTGPCKNLSEKLYSKWTRQAIKIQDKNIAMHKQAIAMKQYFQDNGFDAMLLKGESLARYYVTT